MMLYIVGQSKQAIGPAYLLLQLRQHTPGNELQSMMLQLCSVHLLYEPVQQTGFQGILEYPCSLYYATETTYDAFNGVSDVHACYVSH